MAVSKAGGTRSATLLNIGLSCDSSALQGDTVFNSTRRIALDEFLLTRGRDHGEFKDRPTSGILWRTIPGGGLTKDRGILRGIFLLSTGDNQAPLGGALETSLAYLKMLFSCAGLLGFGLSKAVVMRLDGVMMWTSPGTFGPLEYKKIEGNIIFIYRYFRKKFW